MIRLINSLVFGLALLMAQTGCTSIEKARLIGEINAAEARWQAQGITDYRIAVRFISVWRIQTDTLTVRDGLVTEHSALCATSLIPISDDCVIESIDPQAYTVEGLFARARNLVSRGINRGSIEGLSLRFDPVYGYPASIASSPPELIDADSSWNVEEFVVLS
jgi:hypothetical protein